MDERALGMLRSSVEQLGSIQAAADRIGYSRTAVSLLLAGKYTSPTEKIERAIFARLDTVACPYLGQAISRETCAGHHAGDVPLSDKAKLKHWVACRKCPVLLASQKEAS